MKKMIIMVMVMGTSNRNIRRKRIIRKKRGRKRMRRGGR
jgi:hypothetical protein